GVRAEPPVVRACEGGGRMRYGDRDTGRGGRGGPRGEHGRVGLDGPGSRGRGAAQRLPGLHRGRRGDEAGGSAGDLPPLLARAPRRGSRARGDRRAPVPGVGRSREPVARPEGAPRHVAELTRGSPPSHPWSSRPKAPPPPPPPPVPRSSARRCTTST